MFTINRRTTNMSYPLEQSQHDLIKDPEFQYKITAFVHELDKNPLFGSFAQMFTDLMQSKILELIASLPEKSNNAYACLVQYTRMSKGRIPSSFPEKFIAVAKASIAMQPTSVGIGGHTYLAKIRLKHVKPVAVLTNFSIETMTKELARAVQTAEPFSVAQPLNPNAIQLKMSSKTLDYMVNVMVSLNATITEGYRICGYKPDPYINTKAVVPK